MSKNAYIVTDTSATVVYEGKPYTISEGQANFASFRQALINGDFEEAISFLDVGKAITNFVDGQLVVKDGQVFFGSHQLHGVVVDKLLSLLADGMKEGAPFIKFVKNLLANPSKSSVDELYDFLAYKELPIDEDGYVVGYKGVDSDFWSKSGNTETTVLQGKVDKQGRILNEVGATIEVLRNNVDDNRERHCSQGLHIGSFDYARGWAGGGKLLMVRFNPADAVSVPTDCSCQKLRVCKYEVLEEVAVSGGSEVTKPFYGQSTQG